eukprot:1143391-Pelagomonas_calceolata.AAC.7
MIGLPYSPAGAWRAGTGAPGRSWQQCLHTSSRKSVLVQQCWVGWPHRCIYELGNWSAHHVRRGRARPWQQTNKQPAHLKLHAAAPGAAESGGGCVAAGPAGAVAARAAPSVAAVAEQCCRPACVHGLHSNPARPAAPRTPTAGAHCRDGLVCEDGVTKR